MQTARAQLVDLEKTGIKAVGIDRPLFEAISWLLSRYPPDPALAILLSPRGRLPLSNCSSSSCTMAGGVAREPRSRRSLGIWVNVRALCASVPVEADDLVISAVVNLTMVAMACESMMRRDNRYMWRERHSGIRLLKHDVGNVTNWDFESHLWGFVSLRWIRQHTHQPVSQDESLLLVVRVLW